MVHYFASETNVACWFHVVTPYPSYHVDLRAVAEKAVDITFYGTRANEMPILPVHICGRNKFINYALQSLNGPKHPVQLKEHKMLQSKLMNMM